MPRESTGSGSRSSETLHALRVELLDIDPPIYRDILVRSGATLETLHEVLLTCFEWSGEHMHRFTAGKRQFMSVEVGPERDVEDEARVELRDVLPRVSSKLHYEYDFGDSWLVLVRTTEIRKVEPGGPRVRTATLVDGARASPPEDCGGVGGYEGICAATSDPNYPGRDDILEWFGDTPFDAEAFPKDEIRRILHGIR